MDIQISEERKAILEEYGPTEYNCCQKTCMAFAKEFPIGVEDLMRVAAPLGGGMGYFGLTCGALAAAGIAFGNHYGDGFKEDKEYKLKVYAAVKEMCEAFEARAGATTCGALKKMQAAGYGPTCPELEKIGVAVAEEFIEKYKGILHDRLG